MMMLTVEYGANPVPTTVKCCDGLTLDKTPSVVVSVVGALVGAAEGISGSAADTPLEAGEAAESPAGLCAMTV